MKWRYKYESLMDTNDADYVYQSGEIGVYDVKEESVDEYSLKKYYKVSKG